jgi:DNA-binding MarR family transcriptional regulator
MNGQRMDVVSPQPPEQPPEPLAVASCLTFRVRQAWLNLRTEVDKVLAAHELSVAGYAALLTLAERPGISAAEVGQAFSMTRQSAAELLAGLERSGLVDRGRPNPADRRVRQTELTEAGRKRLQAAAADVRAKEAELMAPVSDDQMAAASAWLDLVADSERCQLKVESPAPGTGFPAPGER